jgi:hypothetical protein
MKVKGEQTPVRRTAYRPRKRLSSTPRTNCRAIPLDEERPLPPNVPRPTWLATCRPRGRGMAVFGEQIPEHDGIVRIGPVRLADILRAPGKGSAHRRGGRSCHRDARKIAFHVRQETGTPSREKPSAMPRSVTVLPVPVAPAIGPWRCTLEDERLALPVRARADEDAVLPLLVRHVVPPRTRKRGRPSGRPRIR